MTATSKKKQEDKIEENKTNTISVEFYPSDIDFIRSSLDFLAKHIGTSNKGLLSDVLKMDNYLESNLKNG